MTFGLQWGAIRCGTTSCFLGFKKLTKNVRFAVGLVMKEDGGSVRMQYLRTMQALTTSCQKSSRTVFHILLFTFYCIYKSTFF